MKKISQSENCYLDLAKARASFYGFISVPFLELPDERFVGLLRGGEFGSVLEAFGRSADIHPEIREGAALMQSYLNGRTDFDHRKLSEELGLDRTRLYRGVSPQCGIVPPYETLWIGQANETGLLHEMAGIYRECGFTLKEDVNDRLDYIGLQLNFMEQLVIKEIAAREAGDDESLQAVLDHEKYFLLNHVGKWAPSYVSSALGHAQTDFYRGHLHMVKGFIEQEITVLQTIGVKNL